MSANLVERKRWVIPAVLLLSVVISYIDRSNLSYALPKIAEDYGWDTAATGKWGEFLFIAFFFSYGLANLLFSPIAERKGPRKSIMFAVVAFSLFTIAGAAAAKVFVLFFVTRILLGLGEGIHWPMNSKLIKNWFPVNERSRANGMWTAGIIIAFLIAPVVLVPIIDHFGWKFMLVAVGIAGMLITLPLLYFFIYDTPRQAPWLSAAEADEIEAGMEADEVRLEGGYWQQMKPVLSQPVFWIMMLGGIFNNAASHGIMSWLPTYFVKERGIEFSSLWWASSLPNLAGVIGIALWAWVGDRWKKRALLSGVCYLATGAIALIATTSSSIYTCVGIFSVAVFFQMAYTSQEFALVQRIIPKERIGTGSGFYNGASMLVGGVAGNLTIGQVVSATGSYQAGIIALLSFAALAGITMIGLAGKLKY